MACHRRQNKTYGNLHPPLQPALAHASRDRTQAAAEIFRRTFSPLPCLLPVGRCDQRDASSFFDSQLVPVAIQSFAVEDLFKEQLKALRAASLDRHLREINIRKGQRSKSTADGS